MFSVSGSTAGADESGWVSFEVFWGRNCWLRWLRFGGVTDMECAQSRSGTGGFDRFTVWTPFGGDYDRCYRKLCELQLFCDF